MNRVFLILVLFLAMPMAFVACGDDDSPEDATVPVTPEVTERPDPRLRVTLEARAHSTDEWTQSVQARPGQLLRFRLVIRNVGEVAPRARIRVELDQGLGLIGVSTYLRRTDDPVAGTPLEPGLTRQGVVIDAIAPGTSRLAFSLRVATTADVGSRLTVGASIVSGMRRAADTAVVSVVRR